MGDDEQPMGALACRSYRFVSGSCNRYSKRMSTGQLRFTRDMIQIWEGEDLPCVLVSLDSALSSKKNQVSLVLVFHLSSSPPALMRVFLRGTECTAQIICFHQSTYGVPCCVIPMVCWCTQGSSNTLSFFT